LFHPTRLRVRLSPIASSLQSVLRSPVCLYPLAFIYHRRDVPSRSYLLWFKALTISTHSDSQTLTKHVPFASVFPLLKWKQVMRLGAFKAHSTLQKKPRILIQVFPSRLLPAFIGSDLLATTGRSAISQPIDSAFPLRLYLPYLVRVYVKETTRLPSVICTFYSIHPDPNHVDEPCRSCPFDCFPARYA
jgi:hypothetical protein